MFNDMELARNFSEHLAGRPVIVTGASGFIGSHLCRRLVKDGAQVHAISRKPHLPNDNYLQWWTADCTDFSAVQQIINSVRPHVVFHLASHVTGARSIHEILPTFHDNLASTVYLLAAVAGTSCHRVVLAGSSEAVQSFDDEMFARSPYAAAKSASCLYGRTFYRLFDVPVVIPRIFMTYGPGQVDTKKLVPMVILQLLQGKTPQLANGRRLADWIYIDDVVEGLVRAAVLPGIEGTSFDLGTGSLQSVRQVVEHIAAIVGTSIQPAFGAIPDRPFEQEEPADTGFMVNRLGYDPGTFIDEGLKTTVAWYRQQSGMAESDSMAVGACQ